ncbi:hypothetical protein RvY_04525 [Ramazzottius varieornatus]|uniref:Tc1-like transposase DDE domain-containing protein n=1 Tax=Ramazzottius varieornatus TaxID=947166 RepID=A0A1D1UYN2_RAMVA|nr:hypothetical protein RvY_04525 [Ramazzottius varieornatus]
MSSLHHLIRNKNESILDRILTCDEKWILYDNRKRKRIWLDKGEEPQKVLKPELHQKKIMLTVWWTSRGLVHYDFLPPGKTITADYYCLELDTVMKKLAVQQPKLFHRLKPLLLQDNSEVHAAQNTSAKLQESGLEALFHPHIVLTWLQQITISFRI